MAEYRIRVDLERKDKIPILSLAKDEINVIAFPVEEIWVDASATAVVEEILVVYDTITFRLCNVTVTLQTKTSNTLWADIYVGKNDGNGVKKL